MRNRYFGTVTATTIIITTMYRTALCCLPTCTNGLFTRHDHGTGGGALTAPFRRVGIIVVIWVRLRFG